ncbi:MAG: hypothetical protein HQL40_04990 [Alphaproteobacteria bacterium]|nr:hypothetical protein [Alphaproteobacteria bacterium]
MKHVSLASINESLSSAFDADLPADRRRVARKAAESDIRSIRRLDGASLSVDVDHDLPHAIVALVNLVLGRSIDDPDLKREGDEAVAALMRGVSDRAAAVALLVGNAAKFEASAASLGHYNPKTHNPQISAPCIMADADAAAEDDRAGGMVTSVGLAPRVRFDGSGNAANMRVMNLLGKNIVGRDGQSLFSFIAMPSNPGSADLLCGLGMPRAEVDGLRGAIQDGLDREFKSVPGRMPQVLIPDATEECGYLAVTGVKHSGLAYEMVARIKERCWVADETARQIIGVRKQKIGGSNPQNSGQVNNLMQGTHLLLESMPPAVDFDRKAQIRTMARARRSLVRHPFTKGPDFAALVGIVKAERWNNQAARFALVAAMGAVLRDMLQPLCDAAQLCEADDFQEPWLLALDPVERGWLATSIGADGGAGAAGRREAVDLIAERAGARLRHALSEALSRDGGAVSLGEATLNAAIEAATPILEM